MNSAIILAAGAGKRLKSKIPKQYIQLSKSKRIIDFSIDIFFQHNLIDEVILVLDRQWKNFLNRNFSNCKIVIGGETRSQSSYNGLKKCSKKCTKVLIHDAARPFINKHIINKCLKNLDKYDAVVPAIKVSDAVINNNKQYINRNKIKLIQTPQSFKYDKLIEAYKNNYSGIDDFSVLLDYDKNCSIKLINGILKNFKITTNEDLTLAKEFYNFE